MLAEHEIIDIVGEAETARANLQAIFQVFDLTNRANFGSNFVNDVRLASFGTPSNFITPSGVTVPHSLSAEFGIRFTF
jgi:hypothetical protein